MAISFIEARDVETLGFVHQETIGEFTTGNDPDCAFCHYKEISERSAFDLAWPLGSIALKPARGMLVPGYMLAITQDHLTSFAQLDPDVLDEVDDSLQRFEHQSKAIRNDNYFRFEHGSDNVEECGVGAGACIVHAHQHIAPGKWAALRMQSELEWDEIGALHNLTDYRGRPYMYVAYEGRHYAMSEPRLGNGTAEQPFRRLPSQWGRRILAEETGEEIYDWALKGNAVNLAVTMMMHNLLPAGTLTLDAGRDHLDYDPTGYGGYLTRLRVVGTGEAHDRSLDEIFGYWRSM